MHVTAASEPGRPDAANEDWFAVTPGLVIVLDGATARTDTGCRHGVAWYTQQLGTQLVTAASNQAAPLPAALSAAINAVADLHRDCDLSSPGTPSAAVAVLRTHDQQLECLALGDITVLIDTVDGLVEITDDRVERSAVAERRAADLHPIGSAAKATALITMKHAELAARNAVGGFWVAAADPAVATEAITRSVPATTIKSAAVLTDGAARAVRAFGLMNWEDALNLLDMAGPTELIREVRRAEGIDPVGARWPRNKRSDDATLAYLRF